MAKGSERTIRLQAVLAVAQPAEHFQIDVVREHLHRSVTKGHVKALPVGTAKPVAGEESGAVARARIRRHGPTMDVLVVAHVPVLVAVAQSAEPIDIGSRRELFVTDAACRQVGEALP